MGKHTLLGKRRLGVILSRFFALSWEFDPRPYHCPNGLGYMAISIEVGSLELTIEFYLRKPEWTTSRLMKRQ
jgi:hypothetical protein